jgi:hypothetical protein
MSASYAAFLERKAQGYGDAGDDPLVLPDHLFDFQRELVTWAIRKGRAALFADCGLGKTPMQLAWAENMAVSARKPVLIVTPLAVGLQTVAEAEKFGVECAVSRDGTVQPWITVTNYERLERFNPTDFGAVVCDESSAIKSFDGVRRRVVTEFLRKVPYRLLCTATAAPNDYVELGTSSEALGYLGHMDMLSRFFTNREKTSKALGGRWRARGGEEWRFKGHAEDAFWSWVSSWARAMRKPSDMGFDDRDFLLPELRVREHVIAARASQDGALFDMPAQGLREERVEQRQTISERCERAADLLTDAPSAVAWCQLNDEGNLLTKLIDGAVQVSGSDSPDAKEAKLIAFSRGEIRVLVTKPIIGAWGLNWQHCHRMTFFPSHSYEQYYQAVRRSWRFGQQHPVDVDIVTTEGGLNALRNLQRKAIQADQMFDALTAHMNQALDIQRSNPFDQEVSIPQWL